MRERARYSIGYICDTVIQYSYNTVYCAHERDTYAILVRYSDTIYSIPLVFAGVPSLAQLQAFRKCSKRTLLAGLTCKTNHELLTFAKQFSIPASLSMLQAAPSTALVNAVVPTALYVPMDALSYSVHGTCFTGKIQIGWIGQLVGRPKHFVLHVDGKYKLHHLNFILLTLGTHFLRWDAHHQTLSTSFAPLIYLFCKEKETNGTADLLMDAANTVALKYYGQKLDPAAVMSDHSSPFRQSYERVWPDAQFGQCWPHIIRKVREGHDYCSKKWEHFEETIFMLQCIHLAHTDEMKGKLVELAGKLWDSWGKQMHKFWDSNLVHPWDCWSICDFDLPLCTPSNQVQESWHKQILKAKIPGMFKGSTESMIKVALPQLVRMDGYFMPTILSFDVSCPTHPCSIACHQWGNLTSPPFAVGAWGAEGGA